MKGFNQICTLFPVLHSVWRTERTESTVRSTAYGTRTRTEGSSVPRTRTPYAYSPYADLLSTELAIENLGRSRDYVFWIRVVVLHIHVSYTVDRAISDISPIALKDCSLHKELRLCRAHLTLCSQILQRCVSWKRIEAISFGNQPKQHKETYVRCFYFFGCSRIKASCTNLQMECGSALKWKIVLIFGYKG